MQLNTEYKIIFKRLKLFHILTNMAMDIGIQIRLVSNAGTYFFINIV